VARDAGSGPPEQTFLDGWQPRLRTLLAEAVANGVEDRAVLRACHDVLSSFQATQGAST
jgi:hypothetical protein